MNYLIQSETLTALGEAIRAKTGSTELLTLAQMADTIGQVDIGGVPTYYFEYATFDTYSPDYTIHHDLGVVPTFACYFVFPLGLQEGQEWSKPNGMCWCAGYVMNKKIYLIKGQDGSVMCTTGTTVCSAVSDTEVTFSPYLNFKGGYTYGFLVW